MASVTPIVAESVLLPELDESFDDEFPRPVLDPEEILGDTRYEMVRGVVVELEPMATWPSILASELTRRLGNEVKQRRLGRVQMETIFLIDEEAKNRRRPDVSFVSYDRWSKATPVPRQVWPVVPDLAVEVVSPTDYAVDVLAKIREYFEAGVRLVWAVYPELRTVHAFQSFDRIQLITADGVLEGGDVLPGLKVPMAELFEDLGADS